MRLLILGGTVFVGRAITDAALVHGHQVTQFNRGRSRAVDERVETLHGDRTEPAALARAFAGRKWDAVIDTSGYLPQVVRLSVDALRDKVGRYLYISSVSAYADLSRPGYDEDAPLFAPPDPLPEQLVPELYGPLKAGCEGVVREAFADRATFVRPGLIVGPHDPTDRFTWWPARIARGGTVAAPGRPDRAVQLIDARDLAVWAINLLERGVAGAFNAAGPARPLTMKGLLETCVTVAPGARLAWIDDARLADAKVAPWSEMPLWLPDGHELAGILGAKFDRAVAEGLRFRPLVQTIADTLAWANGRAADHAWKAGLPAARELELLSHGREA